MHVERGLDIGVTPSVPRVVIGLACGRRLLCWFGMRLVHKVIRRGFLHQGHSYRVRQTGES
jgi:hypothetical protein